MKDSKKILIKSISDSSKKSDKYLFVLLVTCIYAYLAFSENKSSFEIALIGLEIKNPVYYYSFLAIAITSLFAVVGLNIINYITKRFAFSLELRKCLPEKQSLLLELIPNTINEFIYEELLEQHFNDRPRINDKSRKWTFRIIRLTLVLVNTTALLGPIILLIDSYGVSMSGIVCSIVLLIVIIAFSLFLWSSFRETLQRRIKRIEEWREKTKMLAKSVSD